MNDAERAQATLRAAGERARPMLAAFESVAGYDPPGDLAADFVALGRRCYPPLPAALAHLSSPDPGGEVWLRRFRAAVFDSLQEGLYAARYHISRVEGIEREMLRIAELHAPSLDLPSRSSMGGGNTRALDYEYQAFAFAIRRTLEYLAVAVGAYFKTDCHSIRGLPKALVGKAPAEAAKRVVPILAAGMVSLQDIITNDKHNKRSVRDRLAHWESISAGVLNVVRFEWGYGIAIFGGGHNLIPIAPIEQAPMQGRVIAYEALGPVLHDQFDRVRAFIMRVFEGLELR